MADLAAEHDEEGYFASVSDLMVGILFVFLLMLTVFALNFRDNEEEQKVARDKYLTAVAETEKLRGLLKLAAGQLEEELNGREAARYRLLANLEQKLRDQGLRVTVQPETGILRLPEQLLFEKGQSDLGAGRGSAQGRLAEAKGNLDKLARALADALPCFASGGGGIDCGGQDHAALDGILVEGHSDRTAFRGLPPEKSRDLNDRLSVERALNVFKEISARHGLDDMRGPNGFPLLAVSSYGDRRPIAPGETEEEFRLNRRIDLRFLLSSRPSDDLRRIIDQIRSTLGKAP